MEKYLHADKSRGRFRIQRQFVLKNAKLQLRYLSESYESMIANWIKHKTAQKCTHF